MASVKLKQRISSYDRNQSNYVSSQIPSWLKDSEQFLEDFLKAYYEWGEQDSHVFSDIQSLEDILKIDKTPDRFIQYFIDEFIPSIPQNILIDKRLMIKHAREFYQSKGSEQSYKFLFRIMFNEDVSIHYPSKNLFKLSDANWKKTTTIKIQGFDKNILQIANRKIYGKTSGASAVVDSIIKTTASTGEIIYKTKIINMIGFFIPDEMIETKDSLIHISSRVIGQIGSYIIGEKGSGYTKNTIIPIKNHFSGNGFLARISEVDSEGGIEKINIIDSGEFYSTSPEIDYNNITSTSQAFIRLNVTGSFTNDGEYDDYEGLSSYKVLQDGEYNHKYAYILQSKVPLELFKDAVKQLVHPAGLKLLALYKNTTQVDAQSLLFHLSGDINFNDPNFESSRKFFEPFIKIYSETSNPVELVAIFTKIDMHLLIDHYFGNNSPIIQFYQTDTINQYTDIQIEDIKKGMFYPRHMETFFRIAS